MPDSRIGNSYETGKRLSRERSACLRAADTERWCASCFTVSMRTHIFFAIALVLSLSFGCGGSSSPMTSPTPISTTGGSGMTVAIVSGASTRTDERVLPQPDRCGGRRDSDVDQQRQRHAHVDVRHQRVEFGVDCSAGFLQPDVPERWYVQLSLLDPSGDGCHGDGSIVRQRGDAIYILPSTPSSAVVIHGM